MTKKKNPDAAGAAHRADDDDGKHRQHGPSDSGSQPRSAQLTEAARKYRDNHRWVPLVLKDGKAPGYDGWQKRTLQDELPSFGDEDNIGILLGEPSGNLVRLDADFPAVPDVTSVLFPEPTLMFGRASSPRSGRLVVWAIKSKNFVLPKSMKGHPGLPLHDGKPGQVVFQIQSTGAQAMVPPSIHPDSGEEVTWRSPPGVGPVAIEAPELMRRVGIEAFLMVMAHFWPARGSRNESAMALARVLLEAMAARHPDDAERIAIVDDLVESVAMAGGDGEDSRNGKRRAEATLAKMRDGEYATGMPRLLELLELPTDVAKTFRKWLGLSPGGVSLGVGQATFPHKAPYKAAQAFINQRYMHDGRRTLHRYRGTFWRWTGTSYQEQDEREVIRAEAYQFLLLVDWRAALGQGDHAARAHPTRGCSLSGPDFDG